MCKLNFKPLLKNQVDKLTKNCIYYSKVSIKIVLHVFILIWVKFCYILYNFLWVDNQDLGLLALCCFVAWYFYVFLLEEYAFLQSIKLNISLKIVR